MNLPQRMAPGSLVLLGCCLLIVGCGGGGGSTGTSPQVSIALSAPLAALSGSTTLTYALTGSGTRDVLVEYSLDAGVTWSGAAPAANCPLTKSLVAPGVYTYVWDTVADAVNGAVTIRATCGSTASQISATVANSGLSFLNRSASIDAAVTTIPYANVHRGHYDLSPVVQGMLSNPALPGMCSAMGLRSWRISVGRWEIGPVAIMAPEAAAYSTDATELRNCSREFYRGPATLVGAHDPANYHFDYLDQLIATVETCGAQPYLCFDYMPFTLAANQNPNTAQNLYLGASDMSFSNGIRTSPPLDDAVYAEVVTRVMMHVNGSFANGLNRSITYVEIGNEPDLPQPVFWTGTRAQFSSMYQACSAALAAQFGTSIRVGGGSFAQPGQTFMNDFLANLGGARLDFSRFPCLPG